MPIKIPSAPVRDAVTGEINTALRGEQVQIVLDGTTTPYPIMNAASDLIPSSLVTVQTSDAIPTVYIDPADAADLYLDWYHAASGARNRIDFDAVSRDAAGAAADSAAASASSANASEIAATTTAAEVAALRQWVERGNTIRNLVTDPRATNSARWAYGGGTGGIMSETMVTGATDGPVLPDGSRASTYARYTVTTANTAGTPYVNYVPPNPADISFPAGTPVVMGIYVRPSAATSWSPRIYGIDTAGAAVWTGALGDAVPIDANSWMRVGYAEVVATASGDFIVRAVTTAILPIGTTIDVTLALASDGLTEVPDHFDGAVASTAYVGNAWAGEPNASVSEHIAMRLVRTVNGEEPDASGNVIVAAGGDGTTTWGTLSGKPSTFPPSGHSHLRSEISDASTVGRTLMGAVDAQAARAAIGAGTGNGTSNLVLGTTGTTAAPGSHLHPQYQDAAQVATIADERIALNGGSGGSGSVLVWRYTAGAYPTLPSTKPAGVQMVHAIGPLQPAVVPSWIGTGPTQVPALFEYIGGLT